MGVGISTSILLIESKIVLYFLCRMKEIFGCREDILNEFRASSFRLLYLPPLQCIGSAKLVLQNIHYYDVGEKKDECLPGWISVHG